MGDFRVTPGTNGLAVIRRDWFETLLTQTSATVYGFRTKTTKKLWWALGHGQLDEVEQELDRQEADFERRLGLLDFIRGTIAERFGDEPECAESHLDESLFDPTVLKSGLKKITELSDMLKVGDLNTWLYLLKEFDQKTEDIQGWSGEQLAQLQGEILNSFWKQAEEGKANKALRRITLAQAELKGCLEEMAVIREAAAGRRQPGS
jgi:hypothetical protein